MHVSIDFGATWQKATLDAPANRLAWQLWRTEVEFPQPGYYEVNVYCTVLNPIKQTHTRCTGGFSCVPYH